MKLSIVVINYNTKDILRKCLENLSDVQEKVECEVIVVDNASQDGSTEMVESDFEWVRLIKNLQNVGLAVGGNIGWKESQGEYVLYLGSDAFPTAEVLNKMVKYMDTQADVGILTARLVLRNGKPDMDAHRGFPTPWAALTHLLKLDKIFSQSKLFGQYFMDWANLETPHEIDLCISHFMLVRRQVLERISGWDEEFFVFGEDVDFCYRVKQAGWKIMYLGQFAVLHYKGVGVGRKESKDIKTFSNQSKETLLKMRSERERAMRLFYKKHYEKKYPKVLTWLVLTGVALWHRLR